MSEDQGKSLLEGTNFVPGYLLISKMVKQRSKEIQELEKLVATQSSGSKLIFQKLPKHLRRRAMSHRVKRLPRKFRESHMNQMKKSGLPPPIKRPSRKFRRRPKNLVQDYNRRQRQYLWLETHVWHAKRFQMVNRWGFRLAFKPNDKAFRACYRASAQHCLLQDISYITCVEISGPKSIILNQFKLITNSQTGLSLGAQAFATGKREGNIMIYKKNCYPFSPLGEIKFMWKPTENINENTSENSCIWFWIHPAFYSEIVNNFIDIFDLNEIQTNSQNSNKKYTNNNDITMTELKNSLNRFRLTGPLAHSIIQKLETPSIQNITPWFEKFLKSEKNVKNFNEQSSYWKELNNINSTSELSPHLILNLIVTDPRYSWPTKRTKAVKENTDCEYPETPEDIKFGQIWSPEIRDIVSQNVLDTSQLIEKRKNNLVPDQTVPLDAPAIPIMLVQQPGKKENNSGFTSGWDVILPSNWGRPFWFNFIMWGGRAGGLRETSSLLFEQGFPEFHPDTKAGQIEENRVTEICRETYFRLPPNKRINYTKFSIVCPFHFPWSTLIQEWKQSKENVDNFFVMRDKRQLKLFQEVLSDNKNITVLHYNYEENCLVPVKLTLLKRGKMSRFSIICLPEDCDYKNEPVEPNRTDENQTMRKDIRDAHKTLLKKMKRQRYRARQKGEQLNSSKQAVEEQLEKIKSLWLPETKIVRNSCSREICGFVTSGDFSFTAAKGQCIGYIALGILPVIFGRQQKNIVLVRDTKSKQYKLAKMEIICS